MENSLTPWPPWGPGWGADSHTPGGRGPPNPPPERRRGRLGGGGLSELGLKKLGRARAYRGGVRRGLPRGDPRPGAAPRKQRVALRRGLPPSLGCPVHVAQLGVGRTGPSRSRRRLPLLFLPSRGPLRSLPPATPLARSQSPPPKSRSRGAGGKRLSPRRGAGWAGPRRALSCGAGGGARAGGGGCVCRYCPAEAAAPTSLPRGGPRPHPAVVCRPLAADPK